MAEPTQYRLSLQELGIVLVRHQGLREGRWQIGFEINVGIGVFGPSPSESRPGSLTQIAAAVLTRAAPNTPDSELIVDASKIYAGGEAPGKRTRKAGSRRKTSR